LIQISNRETSRVPGLKGKGEGELKKEMIDIFKEKFADTQKRASI
jgi:hypothetical protein